MLVLQYNTNIIDIVHSVSLYIIYPVKMIGHRNFNQILIAL